MDHVDHHGSSDRDLAERWAAGDERGYELLVTRFAPLVYARCRRALGASDADDATQAVFLVLADKRAQAAASPALAAWLFKVADFVVLNALRDRKRRRQAERSTPTRMDTEEPVMDDLREHLDACLAELPGPERDAVRLHHCAGFSLAEIAAHRQEPLSTIHARVQRGLGRLRAGLVKRGVAVTGVALLACLRAEAAEKVPLTVLAHLRDLNPAGRGIGATSAPSRRAQRWSRPRKSAMTRIALAGAAALLLGSASYHFLAAQDQAPADPTPARLAPRLDPDKAMMFTVMRWNDGARMVGRLRQLPEAALLPAEAETGLAKLAAFRQAVLVIDPFFALSPELKHRQWAMQTEFAEASPEQRRTIMEKFWQDNLAAKQPDPTRTIGDLLSRGVIEVKPGEGALLATMEQHLADPASFFKIPSERLTLTGERLTLKPLPGATAGHLPETHLASLDASADLELNTFIDRGVGAGLESGGTMTFHLDPAGVRFSGQWPWGEVVPQQQVADMLALPQLDLARFDEVPADALAAAAVAIAAKNSRNSQFWISLRLGVEMPLRAKTGGNPDLVRQVNGVLDALEQIDGGLLGWIQPGVPIPTVTLQADLARPAAETLIATLGLTRDAHGVAMLPLGPVMLQLGWKDGHLIATTRPDGLAGAVASGGFTHHEDIKRALAEMPAQRPVFCTLLRPATCATQLSPFLAMAMGPAAQQPLADYRKRLADTGSYASFRVDIRPDGTHVDACGLFAAVAGLMVATQSMHPEQLFKAIN